ncbi:hypothetical protein BV25DRAFT_227787 [Artomyces pyxidatus]|uniref:Uncharacterized protein n=1 Tax=Artomyces pyxidatus TaxID=48021 RepID=A0ACB8SFP0_9AGAM|nr:hypothetical protein BV25DRAFT_227787 [Artomyces pyxidatus]
MHPAPMLKPSRKIGARGAYSLLTGGLIISRLSPKLRMVFNKGAVFAYQGTRFLRTVPSTKRPLVFWGEVAAFFRQYRSTVARSPSADPSTFRLYSLRSWPALQMSCATLRHRSCTSQLLRETPLREFGFHKHYILTLSSGPASIRSSLYDGLVVLNFASAMPG